MLAIFVAILISVIGSLVIMKYTSGLVGVMICSAYTIAVCVGLSLLLYGGVVLAIVGPGVIVGVGTSIYLR